MRQLDIKQTQIKTTKKIFVNFFFGLSFLFSSGQQIGNYVIDGSFEIPATNSITIGFNAAKHWLPLDSLNHSCNNLYLCNNVYPYIQGFQYARTGNSFALGSFYLPNYFAWMYFKNRLQHQLKANKVYCVKFYVNNTNNSKHAIDSYGAHFANSTLDTVGCHGWPLTFLTPQVQNQTGNFISDTLNWTPVSGTFVATGDEKFIVIGNFKTAANTNTIIVNPNGFEGNDSYIDDVSVVEINLPAFAGKDTTIYLGDSLFIGRQPDFAIDPGCIWYKLPNMTTSLDTISGIWVKPSTTSTYVVRQVLDCSPLKWDTVVVTVSTNYVGLDKLQNLSDNINLFPNPTAGNLSISGFNGLDNITFSISNCLGQINQNGNIVQKNNSIIIETSELASGLYQIHLKTPYGIVTKKFVKTN